LWEDVCADEVAHVAVLDLENEKLKPRTFGRLARIERRADVGTCRCQQE
jgi:hypothetical protein